MRELHLSAPVMGPDGVRVSVIKYAEKVQTFERQADGSYVIRFVKDPEHEWLVPAQLVMEKRARKK